MCLFFLFRKNSELLFDPWLQKRRLVDFTLPDYKSAQGDCYRAMIIVIKCHCTSQMIYCIL